MSLRSRLQDSLFRAMKDRDRATVSVLRSTIAAIDNAGAVSGSSEGLAIEASPIGVGASDVARKALSEEEVAQVLRLEAAEREDAARVYRNSGQLEGADLLLEEAALIRGFLD